MSLCYIFGHWLPISMHVARCISPNQMQNTQPGLKGPHRKFTKNVCVQDRVCTVQNQDKPKMRDNSASRSSG